MPGSLEPGTPDPRRLGTLVHAMLAAIEFGGAVDVRALGRLLAERQMIVSTTQIDAACGLVERFLQSPRAGELGAAVESRAEVEFWLTWPAASAERSTVLISGYLDRLYRDADGGWHIIDFKTNRVAQGRLAAEAGRYEMQMLLYGLAAERILGTAPRGLVLHFLRTGDEWAFAWNDEARRRAQTLVDEGIARASQPPALDAAY